jgi:transcriptional regulator with XRE-family HTH domain
MTPAEIRATREALGLTLAQLAHALGVDTATVWRWEHGKHPSPPMLRLALDALEHKEER